MRGMFLYIYLIILPILLVIIPILAGYDNAKKPRHLKKRAYGDNDDTIVYVLFSVFWPAAIIVGAFVGVFWLIHECIGILYKLLFSIGTWFATNRRK